MENYICKVGILEELIQNYDYLIDVHSDDSRWQVFKEDALERFKSGNMLAYFGVLNGKIICEASALFHETNTCDSSLLVSDDMAYLSGFRTIPEYQSMGYFSKLYKFMENDLKSRGYNKLSLGVEPSEVQNMMIYFKWGYTNYIKMNIERYPLKDGDSKEEEYTALYYFKNL